MQETIDTSRTIEIAGSPVRLFALALGGVVMTAGGAAMAFRWLPGIAPGSFNQFIGYAALLFFGLCTVLLFWRALSARGPVVVITPEGIRDARVARELIPWRAIQRIGTWEQRGQKVMVLAIDPAVEAGLGLSRIARWSRGANRALGADGLCVAAQGLKMKFDTLLALSMAYAAAAERGR